ncbi:MAG: ERMES complex subunit mmm1 [Chaenotheca gracillima]|nr:MAG: ERMES complex subunit mmm1 [Chaenotheca gracillima]
MTIQGRDNAGSGPSSPMAGQNEGHLPQSSAAGTHRNGSVNAGSDEPRGVPRSPSIQENRRFRPELLQINDAANRGGFIARDFEQAVVDEDIEERRSPGQGAMGDTRQEDWIMRQTSHSPAMARRGTMGRGQPQDRPSRSRTSSSSSRSTSPPNSVEAFAEPRRRERANTIGSRAGSDLDVGLHRTVSGGTHRRRPTFSEHPHHSDVLNDANSKHGDREDEVGFPMVDESPRSCIIDFEALEEFVAESALLRTKSHDRHPRGYSHGSSSMPAGRLFDHMGPGRANVPQIVRRPASPSLDASNSQVHPVVIDEKGDNDVEMADSDLATPPAQAELNRYSFFSSELDSTVHASDIGDLLMPGESYRDLFTLDPEGGVWWLDVLNPTDEEINAISKAFSIHPLTSEDIKTQEARGKADVIKGFAKRCNEQYSVTPRGEIGLYLGDIQDHLVTMMSNLSHFEMMLSRSHSNYLAQLQVDNIAQGTRANEVLSKMTMIATILVPLNLISGLFGMNVPVPGGQSETLGWFFGVLGIIISIAFFSVCILKKFRYV